MNESWGAEQPLKKCIGWAAAAVCSFHLAYEVDLLRGLIVGFLFCLVPLARLNSNRKVFYVGLGVGFAIYAPQLAFFWTIFQAGAIALWFVLAFWLALFVLLSRLAFLHFGRKGLVLLPILWLGLEFFRSELYYLRFSWLTPGYVFSGTRLAGALGFLGVYGIGGLAFAIAAAAWAWALKPRLAILASAIVICGLAGTEPPPATHSAAARVQVAGVQLEFPDELTVIAELDKLAAQFPNAPLLVLSE